MSKRGLYAVKKKVLSKAIEMKNETSQKGKRIPQMIVVGTIVLFFVTAFVMYTDEPPHKPPPFSSTSNVAGNITVTFHFMDPRPRPTDVAIIIQKTTSGLPPNSIAETTYLFPSDDQTGPMIKDSGPGIWTVNYTDNLDDGTADLGDYIIISSPMGLEVGDYTIQLLHLDTDYIIGQGHFTINE